MAYNITLKTGQKRWASKDTSRDAQVFNVRTEIRELTMTTEGSPGSVGVQKEMFLSRFAPGQARAFKNGIPVELENYSIKAPRFMYKHPIVIGEDNYFIEISDDPLRIGNIQSPYDRDIIIPIRLTADNYIWSVNRGGVVESYGEGNYGDWFPLGDTGLVARIPGKPTECPNGFTEDMSNPGEYTGIPQLLTHGKISFRGVWTKDSVEGDPDEAGLSVTVVEDGGFFSLSFRYRGYATPVTVPWEEAMFGDWVNVPAPEGGNGGVTGVTFRLGFLDEAVPEYGYMPGAVGSYLHTEVDLLNAGGMQDAYLDGLTFERAIDIYDLEGSLSTEKRYNEISSFYRAPRLTVSLSGALTLLALTDDTREWEPFTGVITTSDAPRVRSSVARYSSYQLEEADHHAKGIISILRIFKEHYAEYVNRSFSTDTDAYPTKEEEFTI